MMTLKEQTQRQQQQQQQRQLQVQNGTNLCYPNECEPIGKCELDTQRCIVPGTSTVRNESNKNWDVCDKYECKCSPGFTGPECSLPLPNPCHGPFEERIIQQYHLNNVQHQQQTQFVLQVDPEQAVCYNGGVCQSLIDPLTNKQAFRCNCDGLQDTNTGQPLNPFDNQFDKGSGYNCQHTKYISCVEDSQISNIHYCINGGQCLRILPNDNDTIESLPCTCPANQYEGRHCQYEHNTAPQLEMQYVHTKLLQEEQRINNEKQTQQQQGQGQQLQQQQSNGIGSGGVYTVVFILLLFFTGIIFFVYKRQNNSSQRTVSNITTGMELDVSSETNNNKRRTNDDNGVDDFEINNDNDNDINTNNNTNNSNRTKNDEDDDIELKEII